MNKMKAITIAIICHAANRVYCESIGDNSQPRWRDAPKWQRDSAIKGVQFHLDNPDAGVEDSHNSWLSEKTIAGWQYGPIKDAEKKEHPCFVPYEELPAEQQAKDYLFRGIVHSLRSFVE
jgi:hypothetical protein